MAAVPTPVLNPRRARAGWRATALLALLAVVAVLLGACSSSGGGTEAPDPGSDSGPDQSGVSIVISEFSYQVPESVPAGASVTVRNEDQVGHTVTSDESGIFDVAVAPGEEVTFTAPDEAGQYPFHCIPHPHMTATLVVS